MTLVAGVDSSTQSCKVVVCDLATGAVVRTGRAPHPDGTCVPPDAWWQALGEAIADAGGLDDVAAISVGAQQHGMVALDAHGEPVHDALLWNDTRSADAARDLVDEVGADVLATTTGVVPVASFTITKLRWLADAHPELASRIAAVALPHDWLTWRLRGFGPGRPDLSALTTDHSDASGTGYARVDGTYDRALLSRALRRDADDVVLPRILAPGESAGVTSAASGIPANVTIGVGCGDNAGAALGLGAVDGDVMVSIGTSGVVTAVTDEFVADETGTVAGFADATGRRLPLVATLNAARVLDVTRALLDVSSNTFDALALEGSAGADGLTLRPYLDGERTPNLPTASATLYGITSRSLTRASLARAAVEGLVCGLADGLDALRRHGVEPHRVLLLGGAARSAAVQHIAAAVLGMPVTIPDAGEHVAVGAAAQAAWAIAGARPDWHVRGHVVDAEPTPHVRLRYATTPADPLATS